MNVQDSELLNQYSSFFESQRESVYSLDPAHLALLRFQFRPPGFEIVETISMLTAHNNRSNGSKWDRSLHCSKAEREAHTAPTT
jgi:hypothetical protein